jgi:hypothetical protein
MYLKDEEGRKMSPKDKEGWKMSLKDKEGAQMLIEKGVLSQSLSDSTLYRAANGYSTSDVMQVLKAWYDEMDAKYMKERKRYTEDLSCSK